MIVVKQDLIDTMPKKCRHCLYSDSDPFKGVVWCKLLSSEHFIKYYLQPEYCGFDNEDRPKECPLVEV